MPATAEALAITDRYRRAVVGLRDRTVRLTAITWPAVEAADRVDVAYAPWADRVAATITASQLAGARASAAYVAAFIAAETGARATGKVADIDPTAHVGMTRAGKPIRDALDTSLAVALTEVADRDAAISLADQLSRSIAAAIARNIRIGGDEVMAAPRAVLADAMQADERIAGWVRVAGPGACPVCLAAADGQLYSVREPLRIHNHCACTAEPRVRGLPELASRPTGSERWAQLTPDEQDAAAGPGTAQAIRDGVALHSLIELRPMREQPDQIAQRPLERLAAA